MEIVDQDTQKSTTIAGIKIFVLGTPLIVVSVEKGEKNPHEQKKTTDSQITQNLQELIMRMIYSDLMSVFS